MIKFLGARFGKSLKMPVAVAFMEKLIHDLGGNAPKDEEGFNLPFYQECDADLAIIAENVTNRSRYLRLGPVSPSDPIVDTYFTRIPLNEVTKLRHKDELYVANNGWIWNADPLLNFAGPESKAYLRRDNPWLWSHQKAYTERWPVFSMVSVSIIVHSTPMHVAAYLLDAARVINPDLYVEEKDIAFVSKLGINSLIREAMNAWDPKELSRLVHRFGGEPVGSFTFPPEHFPLDMLGHSLNSTFYNPVSDKSNIVVEVRGSTLMRTHDNETPHQKRTAEDTLPTAALVAMANCAVGSVKGFDETRKYRLTEPYEGIIPGLFISVHRVHPITHDGYLLIARCAFNRNPAPELHSPILLVNQSVHIVGICRSPRSSPKPRSRLHPLYHTMGIHPADADAIKQARDHRAHLEGRKTLGAIAGLPSFLDFSSVLTTLTHAKVVEVEGGTQTVISMDPQHFVPGSVVLYRTWMNGSGMDITPVDPPPVVASREKVVGGLTININYPPPRSPTPEIRGREKSVTIEGELEGDVERLWRGMGFEKRNLGIESMIFMGRNVLESAEMVLDVGKWTVGLWEAVVGLGVEEVNVALYRCDSEERDTIGDGVYDVPGFGPLPYCGFQGFASVIQPVARNNDLGHPICSNLRAGTWMLDYIISRLDKYSKIYPKLQKLTTWLRVRFLLIKKITPSFVPKYFFMIVFLVFNVLRHYAITKCGKSFICPDPKKARVSSLETFAQCLTLSTYQFYGLVKSTGLYPPTISRDAALAAGLPHFATQHMRCWGRDIFISLRGLFLIPGHFDAARKHLLAFGSTLKHGLIPNLLDQGVYPRYNARDAAWWWLWGVQEYCRMSEEGLGFLGVEVKRRFAVEGRYKRGDGYLKEEEGEDKFCEVSDGFKDVNSVGELCHEILERHARGVRFREWNAGTKLDHAMKDEGFEVSVYTRFNDGGVVGGGNRFNCGTWMDKMGDSERAGVKGVPATPRDGAGVEIVGLVKAAVSKEGRSVWPAEGVVIREGSGERTVTYAQWNDMLGKNFEKMFYVPKDSMLDKSYAVDRPELVNRRGIYKDTLGASQAFADYQFRPNFFVALVVVRRPLFSFHLKFNQAPEMFNPDHARGSLDLAREVLLGPLGMKTLDPTDWSYRGFYDNANDSNDPSVAHGFNYHQGPVSNFL
ncbi:amylo-alpha-1,6-glucosidase-domain-containing protein [Chytridium lagenaria]|nr:amylo-alpha-1,6-glucosidase-domain-containing protein [Chytridium lagenaria]